MRVQRATLIAAGTRWRQAACLRIDAGAGTHRGGGDVVVSDCDIVAGDLAGGILVLNAVTARIHDNRIRPRSEAQARTIQRWADDAMTSASMGRLLFSNAVEGRVLARPHTRADATLFRQQTLVLPPANRTAITFLTLNMVNASVWNEFAGAYAGRASRLLTSRLLRLDIRELTGSLWAGHGRIVANGINFSGFQATFDTLTRVIGPVIDAGIVVAGSSAGDIAVSGNAIDGALQGVRIATSEGPSSKLPLRSVRVERNTIRLPVVPLDRPRHGVYLGNAERAWIVDNDIAIETADRPNERATRAAALGLDRLFSEGIRAYGQLGLMLQVRGNVVQNCSDGITVWSYTTPSQRLRLLDGNMIAKAATPWRIRGTATRVNNTPP